jgi:hypothetical protein
MQLKKGEATPLHGAHNAEIAEMARALEMWLFDSRNKFTHSVTTLSPLLTFAGKNLGNPIVYSVLSRPPLVLATTGWNFQPISIL